MMGNHNQLTYIGPPWCHDFGFLTTTPPPDLHWNQERLLQRARCSFNNFYSYDPNSLWMYSLIWNLLIDWLPSEGAIYGGLQTLSNCRLVQVCLYTRLWACQTSVLKGWGVDKPHLLILQVSGQFHSCKRKSPFTQISFSIHKLPGLIELEHCRILYLNYERRLRFERNNCLRKLTPPFTLSISTSVTKYSRNTWLLTYESEGTLASAELRDRTQLYILSLRTFLPGGQMAILKQESWQMVVEAVPVTSKISLCEISCCLFQGA